MKISYKVLKKYKKDIKKEYELAKDLVMHAAEVEEIILKGENLKDVFIGEVKTCEKHPDSEKLNCTTVEVNGKTFPIVCGAPNVKAGIKVPVAVVGAQLKPDFIIAKTKIRGEISEGMICSEDELGLTEVRQEGIMILPEDAPLGMSVRDYFDKNDAILEIDNKAINHRPDLFSHIGIIREIYAINGEKFDYEYSIRDFSKIQKLEIKNTIEDFVTRYIGVKIENVSNIESPDYIKEILESADINSKGLLIDISNYSLYLYGQPTHCFDADKIKGNITIRFANTGEKFIALNDEEYELSNQDIVIADEEKVLALGGVIGGKNSCVDNNTKNIIVESANFEQSIIRKTGKKLGIRTDSLNVFEKDIVNDLQIHGVSLIANELEKNLKDIKITGFSDSYKNKQQRIEIDFDMEFFNKIIGKDFSKEEVIKILNNLGIKINGSKLLIPFWRKDLNYKADIAEEIARITGYDNIESTIPKINSGAVIQNKLYKLKNESREFFTNIGFFDIYNYSFVNKELMKKCLGNTDDLIEMKNPLSEELSHLRGSLIPNLLESVQKNQSSYEKIKLFEIEKVFEKKQDNSTQETLMLSGLIFEDKDILYFDIQNTISNFLNTVGIFKFEFKNTSKKPSFAHNGRTSSLIVRGKEVGFIGEISPKVKNNFELKNRVAFFEINAELIEDALFGIPKYKEISNFQENNFDLNFVVPKDIEANKLKQIIEKSDNNYIKKVNLIDIYENSEKLGEKRSFTYKVFIQSNEKTLDDKDKSEIIEKIITNAKKIGGELR